MPDEDPDTRYAVARTEGAKPPRQWWQSTRESFDSDWDSRKLFPRRSSALAVIWRLRDNDHQRHYRYTLIIVRRRLARMVPPERETVPEPAEERLG